jgi:hypothetical protein
LAPTGFLQVREYKFADREAAVIRENYYFAYHAIAINGTSGANPIPSFLRFLLCAFSFLI